LRDFAGYVLALSEITTIVMLIVWYRRLSPIAFVCGLLWVVFYLLWIATAFIAQD
jgi:hypothetical protein